VHDYTKSVCGRPSPSPSVTETLHPRPIFVSYWSTRNRKQSNNHGATHYGLSTPSKDARKENSDIKLVTLQHTSLHFAAGRNKIHPDVSILDSKATCTCGQTPELFSPEYWSRYVLQYVCYLPTSQHDFTNQHRLLRRRDKPKSLLTEIQDLHVSMLKALFNLVGCAIISHIMRIFCHKDASKVPGVRKLSS
jgi:hypothetical protein